MRQAARRGLLTVMATGSVLASTAGYAYADAGAVGAAGDSPGVGSGNTVQVPVDVPLNVCGNTINVVGLLNPAMGNHCANTSGSHQAGHGSTPVQHGGTPIQHGGSGGSGHSGGTSGAGSTGGTHGSPGVGSGNTVQAPVGAPVNLCGDSLSVIGLGNSTQGNQCATHSGGTPVHSTPPEHCGCSTPPSTHENPPPPPVAVKTPPKHAVTQLPPPPAPTQAVLASTGADENALLLAPAGAAMMLGGLLLYRRSRVAQR